MMYASDRSLRKLAAGLCLLFLLAACGQKGPLYLPGERSDIAIDIPLPDAEEGEAGEDEEDGAEEDSE